MSRWVSWGVRAAIGLSLFCAASAALDRPFSSTADASVPWMINYQGRLTDTAGLLVTGSLTFTFRFYDAATGGNKLWEEKQTVTLASTDNGIFNVVLGAVTALSSVDFNTPMWLSVQISGDTEMTPRQRVTAVGYAINASQLSGLESTKFLRTDVNTSTSGKLTITATVSATSPALVISSETTPSYSTSTPTQMVLSQASSGTNNFLDAQVGGTSKFKVDASGNVTVAGNLAVSGTMSGSTSTTGTTNTSWTIGSGTSAASNNISVLFGQTSGQKSIAFNGASTSDFVFSDPIRLATQSALRLEGSTAGGTYVAFKAPSSISSSVTWTLPSADATSSGQILSSNAAGTLSWVTASSISGVGDITSVTAGTGLSGGGTSGDVTLSLSTPVSAANGGTGISSYTAGDILYASAGTTLSKLAGNTSSTKNFFTMTSSVPAWGTLSASDIASGTLGVANGGTGANLSATGGANQFVQQSSTGAVFTVGAIADADVPNVLTLTNIKQTSGTTSGHTVPAVADDTFTLNAATQTLTNKTLTSPKIGTNILDTNGNTLLTLTATGSAVNGLTLADAATGNRPTITASGTDSSVGIALTTKGSGSVYITGDVTIDTATYVQSPAAGALMIAQDPTASNSDGYILLGRRSAKTGGWNTLQGRSSDGHLIWNGSQVEGEGDSPASFTIGKGASKISLTYDPGTDAIRFSRGVFAQQFRNLVKNGSFEAFSALETFIASTTVTGGAGGPGSIYQGGWANFTPDEWLWDAGKVYQNAPVLFTPGTTVTATTLQQEVYDGKSAVTLEDTNTASNDGPYNATKDAAASYGPTYNDAHVEQTITGLKPSTVYAVGGYMRRLSTTAEAIVDITGEDTTTSTTLNGAVSVGDSKMTMASVANFPDNGIVIVDSEEILYSGRDTTAIQLTGLDRGFNGTTEASHSSGATVTIVPFRHLTTGTGAVTNFTLYKGQFVTTATASDLKIHLICTGTTSGDQCRFDGVQVVEGRSVPQFQPGSIMDTGDQTIYGTVRMGRTSDGRGGVLAVDKAVRTRSIEFFGKDPGLSGTAGGMGSIGPVTKLVSGSGSTITLTASGLYTGVNPRDIQVTIQAGAANFQWQYRECTPAGCPAYTSGGTGAISSYQTATVLPGSAANGVMIAFNSGTAVAGDQWQFFVAGMNMMNQYSSYSGTATYQPGQTRIYQDAATNQLTFQDGTSIVTLNQIVSSGIGTPARVDSPQPFLSSSSTMTLATSQGYTGSSQVTFDVQICADGSGATRDSYQWRDNILNGTNVAAADWDISCTQIPASGGPTSALTVPSGGPSYGFTLTFGSPAGTWQDGTNGDRWQIRAYPAVNSTTVKTINAGNGISVSSPASDTRLIAVNLYSGAGLLADGTGLSLLRTCGNNQVLQWSSGSSSWACATVGTGNGTVTAITAGKGLAGGTITTSGTIDFDYTATLASNPAMASGEGKVGPIAVPFQVPLAIVPVAVMLERFPVVRTVPVTSGSVQVRSAVGSVTVRSPSFVSAVAPSKSRPVVPNFASPDAIAGLLARVAV